MTHAFEPAPTGRARCRACGLAIERGTVRFGERIANPFAEGETTLWFHPRCAAFRRPEPVLEALAAAPGPEGRAALEHAARLGVAHPRLPRIDGAERAPSGRATCRACKEPIARGGWRIRLVFFEEARFAPAGSVHLACRRDYFGCGDVLEPLLHFSPSLGEDERNELRRACAADAPSGPDAGGG